MATVRLSKIRGIERQSKTEANVSLLSSKIFPPTPEDIPSKEEPAESEPIPAEDEIAGASKVSRDTTDGEPQAKKLKSSTEDLDEDDWEAVEKPDEAANVSEEGEKVEAVELDGSDVEQIEKSVGEPKKESKAGAVKPENLLAKDW